MPTVLNTMDMQRKIDGQSTSGRGNGARHVVTVGLPLPYEGIGNALRVSYRPTRTDLPSDMLDLLSKLDGL